MSKRSDNFVKTWVAENIFNVPGLENPLEEVNRLTERLSMAAFEAGFGKAEIEETTGDFEDFLLNAYEQVHDPDEGGFR